MDPCWFDNTKLSKLTEYMYIPVFNNKKNKNLLWIKFKKN